MNIFGFSDPNKEVFLMKITRTLILCSLSLLLVVMSFITAPDEGENIVPVSAAAEETTETNAP